jgi:hypothetical protein
MPLEFGQGLRFLYEFFEFAHASYVGGRGLRFHKKKTLIKDIMKVPIPKNMRCKYLLNPETKTALFDSRGAAKEEFR